MISQQLPNMLHWYSTLVSLLCASISLLTFFTLPCFYLLRISSFPFNYLRPSFMHAAQIKIMLLCSHASSTLRRRNAKLLWSSGAKDEDKVVKMCNAAARKTGRLIDSTRFWLSANYFTIWIFISFLSLHLSLNFSMHSLRCHIRKGQQMT